MNVAAKLHGRIDPKMGVMTALAALHEFALPHIEDQDDLKPYNELVFALVQATEGFSTDLLAPTKRPESRRQPYFKMLFRAHIAAELDFLVTVEKVQLKEAAMQIYQDFRGSDDFDKYFLTSKGPANPSATEQIIELRKNLRKKGQYNKEMQDLFFSMVKVVRQREAAKKG